MRSERLWYWIAMMVCLGLILCVIGFTGGYAELDAFMFDILRNTGLFFSVTLSLVFLAGVLIIVDRIFFWFFYDLFGGKINMLSSGNQSERHDLFLDHVILEAKKMKQLSEDGFFTDDITDNARQCALDHVLDGQELDQGRTWLELLGAIAPTIGFMGTLVGLIAAFQQLGSGGELKSILGGLGLSMTTSLLGAMISVVFLTSAWILGAQKAWLDARIEKIVSRSPSA